MYKNFSEYWEAKKELLEKLGVTREAAKAIWADAVDCLGTQLIVKQLGSM